MIPPPAPSPSADSQNILKYAPDLSTVKKIICNLRCEILLQITPIKGGIQQFNYIIYRYQYITTALRNLVILFA